MKISFKTGITIIVLIAFSFSSCMVDSRSESEFFAMDTVMTITAYGDNSESSVKSAVEEINRLDSLFSVQNQNSEIYKLNINKYVHGSKETLELFNCAQMVNTMTNGAFDVTIEPLIREWGFYTGLEKQVPTQKKIETVLDSVGAEHIKIDKETIVLDKGTSVDFGGIAKGYASKRAAQIIKENGTSSALLSLGGNVRAVGKKPDGSEWSIAIANPDNNSKQAGVLNVSDTAVVTSGGYQRCFKYNGKNYHHIIDPHTGYPADSGLKSVSVVSQDDCLADALSTALFVMGLDNSAVLYTENSTLFGAVFITDENEIYVTDNLEKSFFSDYDFKVIKK